MLCGEITRGRSMSDDGALTISRIMTRFTFCLEKKRN